MMFIENKYDIGQVVYAKTDPEQGEQIVTGILVQPMGLLTYRLNQDGVDSYHYDFEITVERDEAKRLLSDA